MNFSFQKISTGEKEQPLRWLFFAILSLAYLILKFRYHELWKDEWQAWLITRDLPFGELLGQLYYEGHPALWYFYLKFWTWIPGTEAFIFQLAHALPVLAVFYLLIHQFKLSWWITILLPLGYITFFEYGLVNRGYVLVMLFSFLAALELRKARPHPVRLGIYLLLLCQTEVYGLFMTGAFGLYYLLREGWSKAKGDPVFHYGVGAALLGGILFLATVFPRENADIAANAYPDQPFSASHLAEVFQGTHVNTYWLGAVPDTNVFGASPAGIFLSIFVLLALIFLFRKYKSLLAAFLLFQLAFFLFSLLVYPGGVRHWGCALIFWIALLPLLARAREMDQKASTTFVESLIILSVLSFHLYYNILGVGKEIRHPFTNAEAAAEYILENVPENVPLLGMNKFLCTPIVGYLERPVYALPEGEAFSYFRWAEKIYVPPPSELDLFAQFKQAGGLVVINGEPIDTNRYPNLQFWKAFEDYSIKNENFYLYILNVQALEN
ncbi:MAG: hypothetical protein GYB31_03340 [Bacteroidetes bacterium]|nr:hypothetical protein [Bacteroidota bacterium]